MMKDKPLKDIESTTQDLQQQKANLDKLFGYTIKPQLVAHWSLVDGKLLCEWLSS